MFGFNLSAQEFDFSAEIRPRFEGRQGFQTLLPKGVDGTNFISQRSRLIFRYKHEKIKFGLMLQNVRVWGDVATMANDDKATSFHEAWAEVLLTDKVSLKMGRQEIIYDDHRIFGNVDWAQQARSHDAFLIKYIPNKNQRLDIGLALNADGRGVVDALYSNAAGYKAFQYAWYHGKFDKLNVSFLLLNTGIEYLDGNEEQTLDYMQTTGPRLTYKAGKFSAQAAAYFQTGKSRGGDVSASYYAGNFDYQIANNFSIGAGMEYLSGKNSNDAGTDVKSFAPLFGTNHKFNGWMDYFYVGNHGGSVGLTDIYATLGYKKGKFSAKLIPHFFSAPADIYSGTTKMDSNLGTEIDYVMTYKVADNISIKGGYSMMFATETMEVLKGGDSSKANTWGWLMFIFKPKLFSHSPAK